MPDDLKNDLQSGRHLPPSTTRPHQRSAPRQRRVGLETNSATKYVILNDLRTAVEDGLLVINDERILREMKSFTHTDADDLGRTRVGHFTNHFDLLMACAIAWGMRKYARVKQIAEEYKQPE